MFRSLLSVSGFTLLSRVTGFVRDAAMAAVMGAGPLSDAFLVAWRLPNHFRSIFAEGAFNAAYIPQYNTVRQKDGDVIAARFADDMMSWQFLVQAGLLGAALTLMPLIVSFLAPGFKNNPDQFNLAVDLSRITFGYLLCVTVVTQVGATLNARNKFIAPAASPVLLNFAMIAALAAAAFFPTAAHAAAWGILAGGLCEVTLLLAAAWRAGLRPRIHWPRPSPQVSIFMVRFGPAVLGSMGVQIALFADTILASFLAHGELTSLYYADRINQLPLGVIGVALGTVLLPEMSRRIAAGDAIGAARAQNRAAELGLLLTLPCFALFALIPDMIMLGLFSRGAFNAAAADMAASVLTFYALGLPAFVLIRTATPMFHARGDTTTPVLATFAAIGINLAIKLVSILGLKWGAEGLALGTSVGAWVNLLMLAGLAHARGFLQIGPHLRRQAAFTVLAVLGMAGVVALAISPIHIIVHALPAFRQEAALGLCAVAAAAAYGSAALGFGLFRRG